MIPAYIAFVGPATIIGLWLISRLAMCAARADFRAKEGEEAFAEIMERQGIEPGFWFDKKIK
jgi:hypothetical protein